MNSITLTTLNARYSHSAVGLRYLYANMKELRAQTRIREFVINQSIQEIAERLLDDAPAIIGIGVYIWNASDVAQLITIIKKVSPQTIVVLGGPEASYTPFRVDLSAADYIIQHEGEIAFYELCRALLQGERPETRIIKAPLADLNAIELPYAYYDDHDVKNRHIYVEASRGCPFLCEFCLSSLDEKMRYFDLERLLSEFETLWQRGVRGFRFIDRTFNLNIRFSNALLDFFLAKEPPYFLHFEVIPDYFPDSLKERIAQFPPACLQLEIGIQTLDDAVAQTISRPLKLEKIERNLRFLENETKAHMHVDLIIGLPGESVEQFGRNLDALYAMTRCEIQVGILKKLSGTALDRHDATFGMVYADTPPYDILQNSLIPFAQMQIMKRFARFWDIFYNSGNFNRSLKLLWPHGNVYESFYAFSAWIYESTQSTWKIALDRQAKLLFDYLVTVENIDKADVAMAMLHDLTGEQGRSIPAFLRPYAEVPKTPQSLHGLLANKRQQRHA